MMSGNQEIVDVWGWLIAGAFMLLVMGMVIVAVIFR
jgi:hypothetical protein